MLFLEIFDKSVDPFGEYIAGSPPCFRNPFRNRIFDFIIEHAGFPGAIVRTMLVNELAKKHHNNLVHYFGFIYVVSPATATTKRAVSKRFQPFHLIHIVSDFKIQIVNDISANLIKLFL